MESHTMIPRLLSPAMLCLLLIVAPALAEQVERRVTGYGVTPQEAVSDGLIEALKQIGGVAIDARQAQSTIEHQLHQYSDGGELNVGGFALQRAGRIELQTQGIIQAYRIASIDATADGLYAADVEVSVEIYETPGFNPQGRRKLAVMPIRVQLQPGYRFGDFMLSGQELSRRLTHSLVNEFTQSRRFSVMDRDYVAEYLRERAIVIGPDAPLSELAKVGQVLGVDYLIVGQITDAELSRSPERIATLGETVMRLQARVKLEYRVLVMATRQVKWSSSVDLRLDDRSARALLGSGTDELLADRLIGLAAARVAQEALNNIYPIRVVLVRPDGTLVLNQGGITVAEGEEFDVFVEGREIFDPYTKESLGRDTRRVARAQIVAVDPKSSVASLVEGSVAEIGEGALLRRARVSDMPPPRPNSPEVYTPAF